MSGNSAIVALDGKGRGDVSPSPKLRELSLSLREFGIAVFLLEPSERCFQKFVSGRSRERLPNSKLRSSPLDGQRKRERLEEVVSYSGKG